MRLEHCWSIIIFSYLFLLLANFMQKKRFLFQGHEKSQNCKLLKNLPKNIVCTIFLRIFQYHTSFVIYYLSETYLEVLFHIKNLGKLSYWIIWTQNGPEADIINPQNANEVVIVYGFSSISQIVERLCIFH